MKKIVTLSVSLLFFACSLLAQQPPLCEDDVDATQDTEVVSNTLQASNKLTVNRKIEAGDTLRLIGGQTIELLPGFEAEEGSFVEGENGDCIPLDDQCGDCQEIGLTNTTNEQCSYEWQNEDIPEEDRNNLLIEVCPKETTVYTLKIIYTDGHIEEMEFEAEVEEKSTEFKQDSYNLCEGESVELELVDSYETYQWSREEGGNLIGTQATYTAMEGGTYYVTVTDACDNTYEANVTVQAVENPTITFTTPDPSICFDSNSNNINNRSEKSASVCAVNEIELSVSDEPETTYQWSTGDPGNSTSVSETGTYIVEATNESGCVAVEEQEVTECFGCSEDLRLSIDGDLLICGAGEITTLTANVGNGDGTETYVWSTNETTPSIDVSESGTYSVTVTRGNESVSKEVEVYTVNSITVQEVNGVTESMEKRQLMFEATLDSDIPESLIQYVFKYEYIDLVSSGSSTEPVERIGGSDVVPSMENENEHMVQERQNPEFSTWILRITVEVKVGESVCSSESIDITVYDLGIIAFDDDEYKDSKFFKVRVGYPIYYEAEASPDCTNWSWEMVNDKWQINTVNKKTGSDLEISPEILLFVPNEDFGDATSQVKVSCTDADGNEFEAFTHENEFDRVKIFYDPDKDVYFNDINESNQNNPPCWFYFWQNGDVVDKIELFEYKYSSSPGGFLGRFIPNTGQLQLSQLGPNSQGSTFTAQDCDMNEFSFNGNGVHLASTAQTIAHELHHRDMYDAWCTSAGCNDDADGDWLSKGEEEVPGTDPIVSVNTATFPCSFPDNADSFGYTSFYPSDSDNVTVADSEVRCQVIELDHNIEFRPQKDWSADEFNPKW